VARPLAPSGISSFWLFGGRERSQDHHPGHSWPTLAVRSVTACLIAAATLSARPASAGHGLGERSGVPVIANPSANADPAPWWFDAIGAAQAKGTELCLSQQRPAAADKQLMEETGSGGTIDRLAPSRRWNRCWCLLDASQGPEWFAPKADGLPRAPPASPAVVPPTRTAGPAAGVALRGS